MTKQNESKLSLFQFTLLIFALTSGGPFGIETAIQSGGIFLTLIGLIIIPIIYSIPQSLMCSELGSMMPSHHGYIVWSFRAFRNEGKIGNFLGFYNAIGSTLAMAKDIPLYITVMEFYFQQFLVVNFGSSFSLAFYQQYLFKFIMIMCGALVNITNISMLGNCNLLVMILVFLPFIAGFFYTLPQTSFENITCTKVYNDTNEYQLGLWLSTLLWCHTGWDTVGCLTADISFNKNKLIFAFLFAVILCYISYTIPILGAITQPCPVDNCWDDGYLYVAYNKISPGIGLMVIIAGFVSNFGIYISEMCVQARTFWALSQPWVILKDGNMFTETYDGDVYDDDMNIVDNFDSVSDTVRIRIGILPHWLCGTLYEKTGSPVRGVILQSLISCILVTVNFGFLLQATVLINCITWIIELCSFLRMRYSEPNACRPYKVPGGMFVAWLITIDKIIVVLVLLALVLIGNPSYGWVTIGSFVLCLLWYIIYIWNIKQMGLKNKLNVDLERVKVLKSFDKKNYGSIK